MQWNHLILMSQARAVVWSSGSRTSLSIRSYLGNLKWSGHSQGPAIIRNSDQGSWKSVCFKMLSQDTVARPAHLTCPLDEQRGFLLTTLQSDDPPKADILRLEGTCYRTRQQDPGRRWGFSKVLPQSESRSLVSDSLWPHGLYTVHGILQARILEWVAFPFSRWSSWPRDQTCVSCISRRILYHWVSSAWAPSLASELETRDTHLVLLYQLDIQRAYRGCGDTRKGHLEPQLLGLAFCWRRRKVYSGAVRVWCNHTPDREEKPELMKRALIKDKTTCGPWLDGKMGLEQEYFHSCA